MDRVRTFVLYLLLMLCFCTVHSDDSDELSCGKIKVAKKDLAFHAAQTKMGEFPWHCAIYQYTPDFASSAYSCGGTLINKNWVLTAAHCVTDQGSSIVPDAFVVKLGKYRLFKTDRQSADYDVFQINVHENYNYSTNQNDIALLKLFTEVVFTNFIQPACLWSRTLNANITNKVGTVPGWGRQENGLISDVLKKVELPVASFYQCLDSNRLFFGQFLSPQVFCAGRNDGQGVNVCDGDSGGAMLFELEETFYARGIVSFSPINIKTYICDTKQFSGFIDVLYHLDWIEEKMTTRKRKESEAQSLLALPGEFPYTTGLGYKEEDGSISFIVGGVLLNARYVLTVAHAIRPQLNVVRLGATNFDNVLDDNAVDVLIEQTIAHPSYSRASSYNDIALLKLAKDVTFSSYIRPACIWTKPSFTETKGIVSGFGVTEFGGAVSTEMIKITMELVTANECRSLYDDMPSRRIKDGIIDSQLCFKVKEGEVDACQGFSGDPVQIVNPTKDCKYQVVGLVTFGRGCGQGFPTVFTKIYPYLNWIKSIITPISVTDGLIFS